MVFRTGEPGLRELPHRLGMHESFCCGGSRAYTLGRTVVVCPYHQPIPEPHTSCSAGSCLTVQAGATPKPCFSCWITTCIYTPRCQKLGPTEICHRTQIIWAMVRETGNGALLCVDMLTSAAMQVRASSLARPSIYVAAGGCLYVPSAASDGLARKLGGPCAQHCW